MAVYVDDELIQWRGKFWCHMVADSLPELHTFALELGLKKAWFQNHSKYPHYDVTVAMRNKALSLGAKLGDRATIVACAKELRVQLNNHNTNYEVHFEDSLERINDYISKRQNEKSPQVI